MPHIAHMPRQRPPSTGAVAVNVRLLKSRCSISCVMETVDDFESECDDKAEYKQNQLVRAELAAKDVECHNR